MLCIRYHNYENQVSQTYTWFISPGDIYNKIMHVHIYIICIYVKWGADL